MVEVSHLIARFLAARGVDRVFSLCGGYILPIWHHAHQLGIRVIDVRDERAAVHMAHAHLELPQALQRAFEQAPALLDVVVTRDATSPDALSGLPGIPDLQALTSWDKLEKARWGR